MKHIRPFLAAVLTLSLMAGFGRFLMKQTASAATKKAITVKEDDFTLKLPASWKENYTVEKSGKDDKNSFVSFYAKECHGETGEGFLFSISKYKDKSYKELPAYEVVGKWNGVSYVAEFPTDVQFAGASAKAVKQYQKLNKSVEKVVRSIAG